VETRIILGNKQIDARVPGESMNASQKRSMGGFYICLNWKVVAGLAVVGLGTWVVAPNLVWAAVPVLVVLACPLSMLFMMRGMGSAQCATQTEQDYRPCEEQLAQLRARHVALTREIAQLESASDAGVRLVEVDGRTNDAHVHQRS
jgi:Protein of unknown function (DUF2933)